MSENDKYLKYKDKNVEIFLIELFSDDLEETSYCYAGIFEKIKGNINKDKLKKFKVKGKMTGDLVKNGTVVNEDGATVNLSDVVEEDENGPAFMIIDCREKKFINSLSNHELIKKLFLENQEEKPYELTYIVHFGSQEIIYDPKYQEFLGKFG